MSNAREYLEMLASTIGPRPTGSDSERSAAEWLKEIFDTKGLATEIQDFDAPRTTSWAYVLYFLVAIAMIALLGWLTGSTAFKWALWMVLVLDVMLFSLELNSKRSLSSIMPKGPSQNVIARYIPHVRHGERKRKVVLVAHYDTALASPLTSESLSSFFPKIALATKWIMYALPLFGVLLVAPIAFLAPVVRWLWYVALLLSVVPFLRALDATTRQILKRYSPGANDNASGVVAMLGVMEELAQGGSSEQQAGTSQFKAVSSGAPSTSDVPDDFSWAEAMGNSSAQGVDALGAATNIVTSVAQRESTGRDTALLQFDTIEFGAVGSASQETVSFSAVPSTETTRDFQSDIFSQEDVLGADLVGGIAGDSALISSEKKPRAKRAFGFGKGNNRKRDNGEDSTDWLGLEAGFDARSVGNEIGTWDNFGSDDDMDGFGWKGGWAGEDIVEDDDFAVNEAARIRRRVTDSLDLDLDEKELWFVATGSHYVNSAGMRAFLAAYADDLKDALIINIDAVGAGELHWNAVEGVGKSYQASARLTSLARRVSRATETRIKALKRKGVSTEATPALAARLKAFSIVRAGENGYPVAWHSADDTFGRVDVGLVDEAAGFVAALIREA